MLTIKFYFKLLNKERKKKRGKKLLKKILKYNISIITIFIICIFVIIVSSITTNYYKDKKTEGLLDKAENYETVIANKEEKVGKFVYIKIADVPYLVATETSDESINNYYVVYDENNYMYIVQLKKSTYKTICDEYEKNSDNFSYLIMGRLANVENDLEKIIIDEFNESNENTKLNRFNYNQYFGTTYLNENILTTYDVTIGILELCLFVAEIIAIIYLVIIIKGCININKSFKCIDNKEFNDELLQTGIIEYSKAKIFLLDNYFVSMNVGMIANKYSDIAWVYISNIAKTRLGTTYYSVINKSNMVVYLKDGRKYTTATLKINEKEIYVEIIEELAKRNPDMMIGYSFENLNNYNKIKNQNKKS